MRIGVGLPPTGLPRGEAPGGGPILSVGISAMSTAGSRHLGSSIDSPPKSQRERRVGKGCSSPGLQPAGRRTTPSNVSPVVTKRHSAMTSLRASAVLAKAGIIVLRVPIRLSAVRARYHSASALSF